MSAGGVNCAGHGVWAVKRVRQDKAGRVGGSRTTKGFSCSPGVWTLF